MRRDNVTFLEPTRDCRLPHRQPGCTTVRPPWLISHQQWVFRVALLGLALTYCARITPADEMKTEVCLPNQVFQRTYKVNPATARLSLRSITGRITITTDDKAEIRIRCELSSPQIRIIDSQTDDSVQIEVLENHPGSTLFDVVVPPQCALELKCLNGPITAQDCSGPLSVETTDGDIALRNIRSREVIAYSTSGKVLYDGDINPQGNYTFQSFNNLIDVTVPATATFQLAGTSFSGDVQLGGFEISNFTAGSRRLTGSHGNGGGKIHLITHRGQIRFHKR